MWLRGFPSLWSPASGDRLLLFFFSSRRRHTRSDRDWSSDVCSSDLESIGIFGELGYRRGIARLLEEFACAAVVDGKQERALRLAGAAAALREALGARLPPDERPKLERLLAQARAAGGPAAAQPGWTEGAAMPLQRVIDYGLTWTAG